MFACPVTAIAMLNPFPPGRSAGAAEPDSPHRRKPSRFRAIVTAMNGMKGSPMKTTVFAALTAAFTLALLPNPAMSAPNSTTASDPRKCGYSTPRACAADNAFLAVRRYMSTVNHLPSPLSWGSSTHTCVPAAKTFLIWRCSWDNGGAATVTFRALANGWHTRVALAR